MSMVPITNHITLDRVRVTVNLLRKSELFRNPSTVSIAKVVRRGSCITNDLDCYM